MMKLKKDQMKIDFFRRVSVGDYCWEWIRGKSGGPYGRYFLKNKKINERSHRASWIINVGPIKNDLHVLHRCDNPMCVRPSHLFLGTPKDNTQDMMKKGRCKTTKITEKQATSIRNERLYKTIKELCSEYKLGHAQIERIIYGSAWSHILNKENKYDPRDDRKAGNMETNERRSQKMEE